MSKSQSLRALVSERLTAAAEDIFALVERTIAEYEEELCRSKQENQRKQEILDELLKTHRGTWTGDKSEEEEERPPVKQENVESCVQWKQQHFQDLPPKPEPAAESDPEESESGSSDTDEEPLKEADQDPNYDVQTEMDSSENVGEKLLPGSSSNPTRKFSRPPKQCAICGKVYGDLKRHMTVHTGEKPFSCSVCGKRFTRRGTLKSLMAVHRGDTPYRCSVCGKMFSQKGNLHIHVLMHSGEKPFSCSVCKVSFTSKGMLDRHKRAHTGVRPFSCPFCERGFTRKEHLKRHVQTHSGVSPESFSSPSTAQATVTEQREAETSTRASQQQDDRGL